MTPPTAPFTFRDAAPSDVPDVLRLVRGLAEYERLLHEVVMTEADLHAALFGPQPRAHARACAHAGGAASASRCGTTPSAPSAAAPTSSSKTCSSNRHIAAAASAWRCCATSRNAPSPRIAAASNGAC